MNKREEQTMVREILIGAGSVIAIAAIIYAIRKYQLEHQEEDSDIEKIYLDEVNLGEIKGWFKDKISENKKGVIFYPTKENTERWKVKMPSSQNLLIQIVYDVEADSVSNYREISFSSLSPKFKELMDENGGTVVVEL